MNDEEIRKCILKSKNNIVVNAGAGAGKTSILVNKIQEVLNSNKKHYKIIATTFTNKATDEIKNKLEGAKNFNIQNSFIGTNDNFAMNEIIRAFLKDVYSTCNSTTIECDYKLKFNNYNDGVDHVIKDGKIGEYKNDEGSLNKLRNFKFQLALDILKKSLAARRYIQSKYFYLFVDEYQDCDIDMHSLYKYICKDLNITMFAVGDIKQAIFTWRGGKPEFLIELSEDENFEKFELLVNFRSTKEIQNYANIFVGKKKAIYENIDDEKKVTFVNKALANKLFDILDYTKRIVIIRRTNDDVVKTCEEINSIDNSPKDFIYIPKSPFADLKDSVKWIADEIMKLIFNDKYTEYNLKSQIPYDIDISCIAEIVKKIKNNIGNNDRLLEILKEMFELFEEEYDVVVKNAISEVLEDKKYQKIYQVDSYNHIVMTLHSVKGLEYDEVVIYDHEYNLNDINGQSNHYVAITRAKDKLIIIDDSDDWRSKKYISKLVEKIRSLGSEKNDIKKYIKVYTDKN